MPKKRRNFRRAIGKRPYKKIFIIAVEGYKTEPQYFSIFSDEDSEIKIKCLKSKYKSSPPQILKNMENYLNGVNFYHSDEAWIVVDKDSWTDDQLIQLFNWGQSSNNYGFALSNPNFEYWLLLHFEDGNDIHDSRSCNSRLKRYLPNYDKCIEVRKFKPEMIINAVHRAKIRDNPPCKDWPRKTGTTVYRLVEKILISKSS